MIDGDIQVGKSSGQVSGLMYGILNLLDIGKTIDPGLDITGRMLDINTAGNTGMVVRSSLGGGPTAVALGIGPSYIGTRTAHALQFWTDTLTRMIILETGNVGIAPTLCQRISWMSVAILILRYVPCWRHRRHGFSRATCFIKVLKRY